MHEFRRHPEVENSHAFLSASKYHWLNYDDEQLLEAFDHSMDAQLGTRLHALAAELIMLGVKLRDTSQTLNLYVNDCIGYRMQPEVVVYYSPNCYGTADAIKFEDDTLYIFDLKNGSSKASFMQLHFYAAVFCLEYKVKPSKINFDLRIYQNDDIERFETDPDDIVYVMTRVVEANELIQSRRESM